MQHSVTCFILARASVFPAIEVPRAAFVNPIAARAGVASFTVRSVLVCARAVRCTQRCVLLSVVYQDTRSRLLLRTLI